ncbi:peroxisomal membrane protein pex14 [Myotisia sp. PD_48]|nr:peroxisomal membrane protein pex14 [Myotisia sp. PD_48]
MAREELISSAVTFLQDPSVSTAPIEKKIAFLQSKNLTQDEIDQALSRSGASSSSTPQSADSQGHVAQQNYRQPHSVPQTPGFGAGGQWNYTPPPPELPKRDWRDWFIMATVAGGVGYGLYFVAKRYISPLIAPPTPPQLQQDKENIDEQFNRAFTLLDQLSSDTAALKLAEEARTTRLDSALRQVEDVVAELKSSSRRRDDDTRRISDEVRSLKDGIPKAIEGAREGNEKRLRELNAELKSLKVLLSNRLGPGNTATPPPTVAPPRALSSDTTNGILPQASQVAAPATIPAPVPAPITAPATVPAPLPTPTPAPRDTSVSPFSQLGKPASIPAWQLAASNKPKPAEVAAPVENTGESSDKVGDEQQPAPPS